MPNSRLLKVMRDMCEPYYTHGFRSTFSDLVWFLEPGAGVYVIFGKGHMDRIHAGAYRL